MTKAQRDFLKSIATDNLPVTYTDSAVTVSVYAARLRFSAPDKRVGRAEEVAELVLAEASGSPWASSSQAAFLRACGDDVTPLFYTHTDGKQRACVLTRISWATPYKGPAGNEPVVQLRLVEAVGPSGWLSYAERAKIEAAVSLTIRLPEQRACHAQVCFSQAA